jgi:hypothetical protein
LLANVGYLGILVVLGLGYEILEDFHLLSSYSVIIRVQIMERGGYGGDLSPLCGGQRSEKRKGRRSCWIVPRRESTRGGGYTKTKSKGGWGMREHHLCGTTAEWSLTFSFRDSGHHSIFRARARILTLCME